MPSGEVNLKGSELIKQTDSLTHVIKHKVSVAILFLAVGFCASNTSAQFQPSYDTGMGVAPAYEGWVANPDGSYTMLFGYMNENWEEELTVPIGSENSFSPQIFRKMFPSTFSIYTDEGEPITFPIYTEEGPPISSKQIGRQCASRDIPRAFQRRSATFLM